MPEPTLIVAGREILPEVSAATLLAHQCGPRDEGREKRHVRLLDGLPPSLDGGLSRKHCTELLQGLTAPGCRPEDAHVLLPGHAYFLAKDGAHLARRLRHELIPLLTEYLQEGRLGPCATELDAYIDWLQGELGSHGQA